MKTAVTFSEIDSVLASHLIAASALLSDEPLYGCANVIEVIYMMDHIVHQFHDFIILLTENRADADEEIEQFRLYSGSLMRKMHEISVEYMDGTPDVQS